MAQSDTDRWINPDLLHFFDLGDRRDQADRDYVAAFAALGRAAGQVTSDNGGGYLHIVNPAVAAIEKEADTSCSD